MAKTTKIFVYGTLKGMGAKNTRFKEYSNDIEFLGYALTRDKTFEMWDGPFPVVVKKEGEFSGHVLGEVYKVTDKALSALDAYEGAPHLYKSEPVETVEYGLCQIYLGNNIQRHSRPIMVPDDQGLLYWPTEYEH